MNEEKIYLSKEKLKQLQTELEELKTVKRKEVAENLESAKSLGDLSENAEYQEARELQAQIEDRIGRLEMMLKSVEIVSSHHSDVVEVGSTVVLEKIKSGTAHTYQIVGSEEADMSLGKLSNQSPLGSAVMGKKKGETFNLKSPAGPIAYKIVEIE